jgi:hypothetical protein
MTEPLYIDNTTVVGRPATTTPGFEVTVSSGPQGPQGPPGPSGPQGPAGVHKGTQPPENLDLVWVDTN